MQLILFLIGFFSISQLGLHFWPSWSHPLGIPVDYLSLTIYFTDILLLFFLPFGYKKVLFLLRRFPYLLLLPLINILFSLSPLLSLYHWLRLLLLTNLSLVLASSPLKPIKYLLAGLLIAFYFSAILSLLQFLLSSSLGQPFYLLGERTFNLLTPNIAKTTLFHQVLLRSYATFSHPNSLAGFLLVSYYLLLHFHSLIAPTLRRLLLPFLFLGLILTYSRTTLLSFGLTLLFLFGPKFRFIFNRVLYFFPLLTLITLIFSVLLPTTLPQTISERLLLNKLSLQVILSLPFLGAGLGNYLLAQTELISNLSLNDFLLLHQPVHNMYLLLVAELGIIPSVFLFRQFAKLDFTGKSTLFLSLLVILLTSLFDHYWLTLPQNRLLFAILIGLILNPSLKETTKESKISP